MKTEAQDRRRASATTSAGTANTSAAQRLRILHFQISVGAPSSKAWTAAAAAATGQTAGVQDKGVMISRRTWPQEMTSDAACSS